MSSNRPQIFNLTLTLANTEYSQAFTRSFNQAFSVQARTLADIKLAFISGNSGTTFYTIPAGSEKFFNFGINGVLTLYMQSPTAGTVAEILVWE